MGDSDMLRFIKLRVLLAGLLWQAFGKQDVSKGALLLEEQNPRAFDGPSKTVPVAPPRYRRQPSYSDETLFIISIQGYGK